MYSKELEELIDVILADGEITDKERAVLHKRALSEGVDLDELDVVIEGRLAKMQKVERDRSVSAPPPFSDPSRQTPKSNKYGEIRKCPNCGAVVDAGSVKCNECGYNFVGIQAISSRQKLVDIITEIETQKESQLTTYVGMMIGNSKESRICSAIMNFPVPNAKEDLLEFLIFLKPLASGAGIADPARFRPAAYKRKYKECLAKAQLFFSDDPQFQKLLEGNKKSKSVFGKLFGKK